MSKGSYTRLLANLEKIALGKILIPIENRTMAIMMTTSLVSSLPKISGDQGAKDLLESISPYNDFIIKSLFVVEIITMAQHEELIDDLNIWLERLYDAAKDVGYTTGDTDKCEAHQILYFVCYTKGTDARTFHDSPLSSSPNRGQIG